VGDFGGGDLMGLKRAGDAGFLGAGGGGGRAKDTKGAKRGNQRKGASSLMKFVAGSVHSVSTRKIPTRFRARHPHGNGMHATGHKFH